MKKKDQDVEPLKSMKNTITNNIAISEEINGEFISLSESEKKKLIKLLNTEVIIDIDKINESMNNTKVYKKMLEDKFPNGKVKVTQVLFNGDIVVESLANNKKDNTIHKLTLNYKYLKK